MNKVTKHEVAISDFFKKEFFFIIRIKMNK